MGGLWHRQRRPVLCFVHIERAGGTTLHYIFRNACPGFVTLSPWREWTNEAESAFSECEAKWLFAALPGTAGFGGHTVRSYLDYEACIGRPVKYVTFLREPVKRYVSHYLYQKYVRRIPWTMEAFLAERRFDNFMTVRLCGKADARLARAQLEERFAFVGLTDHFDESLVLMRARLEMPNLAVNYEQKNAIPEEGAREDVSGFLEEIRARNLLDLDLYERARGLFEGYRRAFAGDLDAALGRFRDQNRGYRFPAGMRPRAAAYRWLLYRNVEWLAKRVCRR